LSLLSFSDSFLCVKDGLLVNIQLCQHLHHLLLLLHHFFNDLIE
jgi:hypothetical protein